MPAPPAAAALFQRRALPRQQGQSAKKEAMKWGRGGFPFPR
jgi:hypothetical protein